MGTAQVSSGEWSQPRRPVSSLSALPLPVSQGPHRTAEWPVCLQRPPYFASLRCPRLLSPVLLLRPRPTPAPTPTGMEAPPRQGRLRLIHRPALSRSSANACGRQELAGLDHPCLWLPCRALGGFTPGIGPPHPPEQPGMDPGQQRRALVLITEAEAGEACPRQRGFCPSTASASSSLLHGVASVPPCDRLVLSAIRGYKPKGLHQDISPVPGNSHSHSGKEYKEPLRGQSCSLAS